MEKTIIGFREVIMREIERVSKCIGLLTALPLASNRLMNK